MTKAALEMLDPADDDQCSPFSRPRPAAQAARARHLLGWSDLLIRCQPVFDDHPLIRCG